MSQLFKRLKNKIGFGKDFLELLKHSSNYITAELFSKGIAILALPFFTRLMTPEEYGVMAVFVSFIGIFTIIFGMGIRSSIGRYYYEEKGDFFQFFSSNLLFVSLISVILTFLCLLGIKYLKSFFNIPAGMIYLGMPIVVFMVIFELYKNYYIASRKSGIVAKLTIFQSIISIGLAILIMINLSSERYYARAISLLVAEFLLVVVVFVLLRKNFSFNINVDHIKYSLVFGLPIIFHLLSQNILNTFDQIIINQIVGEKETGIYSIAYRIGMIQSILTFGILRAWGPIFYEKMNQGKLQDIKNLAKKYTYMVTLIAVGLILFSNELLLIFANKSYADGVELIPIIIIGYYFFFMNTIYARFSFYYKKTKSIAFFTIIAGSINIGLNYLLIPDYGYGIAAWTTGFSYFLLFLLHFTNVKFFLKSKLVIDVKIFIFPVLLIIAMAFIRSYLKELSISVAYSFLLRIILFTITGFITFAIFRLKTIFGKSE